MKVFISHAAEDRETAALLAKQLQSEGFGVWTSDEIEPGENWARRVGEQLESADFIVFLMTAAGARSEYVRRNVEFAICNVRYKGRVITAIFDGPEDRQVPWILKKLVCVSIDPEDIVIGMARVTEAVVSLAQTVGVQPLGCN